MGADEQQNEGATIVVPGIVHPGERRYFLMPDRSVAVRTLSTSQDPVIEATILPPEGGQEISAQRGEQLLAEQLEAGAAAQAGRKAAHAEQRAGAYAALLTAGIPDEIALQLSGHRIPADADQGGREQPAGRRARRRPPAAGKAS